MPGYPKVILCNIFSVPVFCFFFFSLFGGTEVWTWNSTIWVMPPVHFVLVISWIGSRMCTWDHDPTYASNVAGMTGMHHNAPFLLVELGLLQLFAGAGLEPWSFSWVARITGINHSDFLVPVFSQWAVMWDQGWNFLLWVSCQGSKCFDFWCISEFGFVDKECSTCITITAGPWASHLTP
jgi:hypothetical protein